MENKLLYNHKLLRDVFLPFREVLGHYKQVQKDSLRKKLYAILLRKGAKMFSKNYTFSFFGSLQTSLLWKLGE